MSKKQRYQNTPERETFIKPLVAKNTAQEFYLNMIKESTITFGVGPAGTGKTFLACHEALSELLSGEYDRIILTRPIVATEDIGFLPGDMNEKINPYLMPLFDAVEDHVGIQRSKLLFESGRIEILPLAFMRGRSINRAIMILDEAQNTTQEQIKMFLTRIGYGSKIIITGDMGQSDLPRPQDSGLAWAVNRLRASSSEIGIMEFASRHQVRNPLIEEMLKYLEAPAIRTELPRITRAVACVEAEYEN